MSDRLEDKLRTVLMGYEFSVDNLREGEHFNFSTLSPAMLDSIVENLKQATQSYTDTKVIEGRYDELNELNWQIAKNDWHKKDYYKMFPYIADRLAELQLQKGKE